MEHIVLSYIPEPVTLDICLSWHYAKCHFMGVSYFSPRMMHILLFLETGAPRILMFKLVFESSSRAIHFFCKNPYTLDDYKTQHVFFVLLILVPGVFFYFLWFGSFLRRDWTRSWPNNSIPELCYVVLVTDNFNKTSLYRFTFYNYTRLWPVATYYPVSVETTRHVIFSVEQGNIKRNNSKL